MPKHDCLPPHQTGREGFPHPAFTQTLAAQPYTGTGRLSSAAQLRSKMRTVPQPCGGVSVGGLLSKRNSHPLIQHVCVPAPSLHGHYPLLRYYEPVRLPTRPPCGYLFPQDVGSRRLARVSQVPRPIGPRAPSPTTPEGPMGAITRYFPIGVRLHHSLAGWPPSHCITRPK